MGNQYVPTRLVDIHLADDIAHGIVVGLYVGSFVGIVEHDRGLDERQQIEGHLGFSVGEYDGADGSIVDGREVNLAGLHDARSEGDALGRVVVAADNEYGLAEPCQTDKEIVEEGDGLG